MRKINVHLNIDAVGLKYCSTVNKAVRMITTSAISFGTSKEMIPHITLAMGYIVNDEALRAVKRALNGIVAGRQRIPLYIEPPYLDAQNHNYVLSEVTGSSELRLLDRDINDSLSATMSDLEPSSIKTLHVTLGYVESHQGRVREYLQTIHGRVFVSCPSVEISDVGIRGTCVTSIYKRLLLTTNNKFGVPPAIP